LRRFPVVCLQWLICVASVFEEEAGSWEEKLNRVHVLFGDYTSRTLKKYYLMIAIW
jgi:hypothetical protein